MLFLENVRAEFTVPVVSVEGGENRHFVIDLRVMNGDWMDGDAFLGIPTRYPYSLSIEERVKSTSLIDKRSDIEYTYMPVVSGILYASPNEIKAIKKDPYKFCIENGFIESNEETKSDNDETSTLVKGNTEDVDTEPEMVRFHIKDWDKIIDPDSSVKEYPLFVRDEHSNDHWIFNYDVLCKALCRKDVTFEISIKIKGHWAQAYCSCNANDVMVHVGGSVLTGKIPDKKGIRSNDAFVEFKASDWKEMDFALVNLRRKYL